jgi:hypothetical protein
MWSCRTITWSSSDLYALSNCTYTSSQPAHSCPRHENTVSISLIISAISRRTVSARRIHPASVESVEQHWIGIAARRLDFVSISPRQHHNPVPACPSHPSSIPVSNYPVVSVYIYIFSESRLIGSPDSPESIGKTRRRDFPEAEPLSLTQADALTTWSTVGVLAA